MITFSRENLISQHYLYSTTNFLSLSLSLLSSVSLPPSPSLSLSPAPGKKNACGEADPCDTENKWCNISLAVEEKQKL